MTNFVPITILVFVGSIALLQQAEGFSVHPEESTPFIPDHVLRATWDSSAKEYRDLLQEQFKNGKVHSRSKSPHSRSTPFSETFDEHNHILEIYTEKLSKAHGITKRQAGGTPNPGGCRTPSVDHCEPYVTSKYRTIDGTCNNVGNLHWGAANRPVNRLLEPVYEDGWSEPRGGFNSSLPNPRRISTRVSPDRMEAVNARITNLVPQFGQYLDHDITLTPAANRRCCAEVEPASNCWTIFVGDDPFYQSTNQSCMDFTRSTYCVSPQGHREQLNANTAFIDGSQTYGSDEERAHLLREFRGGRLQTNDDIAQFMPSPEKVGVQTVGSFAAGDNRVNAMPALAVMHTVWLIEHNRIASDFERVAPHWDDERIYQETRRIVIAEMQNIAYNEYLPIILGTQAMLDYHLEVTPNTNYNPSVDPTIFNEFATAAYRFGHSLVNGVVQMMNSLDQVVDTYSIKDEYFQSGRITAGNGNGYNQILRGLMRQNSQEMDRFVSTDVTNFLFRTRNQAFGSDLVARNIQRGRDHGVKSYNDYRVLCDLSDLSERDHWTGAVPEGINEDGWALASLVYEKPTDIDLFLGGIIEIPVDGGLSGNTFTCLKAKQFQSLKDGDRYFFTHPTGGFTREQMENIMRRRYGDVICDTSMQPNTPRNVFLVEAERDNPLIPCGQRPQIDVKLFV